MKNRHWFASGVLACVPLTVLAQPAPGQPRPEEASAAVPALVYISAFDGFSSATPAQEVTPDRVWRTANDQLARPSAGHAQHEPEQEAKAPPKAPDAPPVEHQHQHQHQHEGK